MYVCVPTLYIFFHYAETLTTRKLTIHYSTLNRSYISDIDMFSLFFKNIISNVSTMHCYRISRMFIRVLLLLPNKQVRTMYYIVW